LVEWLTSGGKINLGWDGDVCNLTMHG